ncbi:fluoride efflux transporter CrcB [Rhodobacter maris]|uniref:Fluoride-specific ion channel FluC n=1 Tax=Rhodobacter maris TaxID=446682 RepID=A0A285RM77_9RHOB|nr:fluoride efflux transporter CrcB [Rhodobacter maris]SOB94799.1 camphor resistance protein CrcB [Rhodobacter maris]
MIQTLLTVALGGALGASARYLVNITMPRLLGHGFPYATMMVNILGSFLMGVMVVVLAQKGGTRLAPFLMTGVLGGFTTFSAFSLDAAKLYEAGEGMAAAGYVIGSVVIALAALFAGMAFARGFFV